VSTIGCYPEDVLRRLHEAELSILVAIDDVCREAGLTYFIEGGTTLGAVRHGGFIPWDDDIDVGMPPEDYLRFVEVAPTMLPKGMSLHTPRNTKGMSSLWAKVYLDGTRFMDEDAVASGCEQGIFVDVFRYCPLDKDPRRAKRQVRDGVIWQSVSYLYYLAHPHIPPKAPFKPLLRAGCEVAHAIISRVMTPGGIEERFERAWETNAPSDRWVCCAYASWGVMPTDVLFPTEPLSFEGRAFSGPHDADAYLRTMYGEYMTIPPVEERRNHLPLILDFGDGVNVMEE
jgi:lipopolysaccharide cholinephosphotransferase